MEKPSASALIGNSLSCVREHRLYLSAKCQQGHSDHAAHNEGERYVLHQILAAFVVPEGRYKGMNSHAHSQVKDLCREPLYFRQWGKTFTALGLRDCARAGAGRLSLSSLTDLQRRCDGLEGDGSVRIDRSGPFYSGWIKPVD